MENNQSLAQAQAEIARLTLELSRTQAAKNQIVSVCKKNKHVMFKRAGAGWPVLVTPEDLAIIIANLPAAESAAKLILDSRV